MSSHTFQNVTAPHTISASFARNTYLLTASAGLNGQISPSGDVTIEEGEDQTFGITANSGYHIEQVVVDDEPVGPVSSYTFRNVSAPHGIRATFARTAHEITARAGRGGTISPEGIVTVEEGGNQTFTIQANEGYHIVDVKADSVSQGPVGSYTFTDVRKAHSIEAFFAINIYTIDASAGSGGTINPQGAVEVHHGASRTF